MLLYGQLCGLVTGLSKQNIAKELFSQLATDTQKLELTEHTFFGSCDKLVIGFTAPCLSLLSVNCRYKEYLGQLTMEVQLKQTGKTSTKNISAQIWNLGKKNSLLWTKQWQKSRKKTLTENFRISYFSSCGQPTVEDEELSGTCNYWLEVRLSSELLRWDSLSNWDNPWNWLQVRFSLRYAQSFSLPQITKLGGIYSIWGEKCGKNLWKFERSNYLE